MQATEHTFTTWDGLELFYRAWIPGKRSDKALLLFHRGHEHSGRWQETINSLGLDDVAAKHSASKMSLSLHGTRAVMAARRANEAAQRHSPTW